MCVSVRVCVCVCERGGGGGGNYTLEPKGSGTLRSTVCVNRIIYPPNEARRGTVIR